jgi:hypothetical protein
MTRMNYQYDAFEVRKLDRSPFRNMPSSCQYCGYRYSSSLSGNGCTGCTLKSVNNTTENKMS